MNIEILGWIATLMLLAGYILNANKQQSSWAYWFVGNSMMLIYAFYIGSHSVAFLSFVLMILNIYGYICWEKNK
jgi:nicotinamide riboside transporter PnuC